MSNDMLKNKLIHFDRTNLSNANYIDSSNQLTENKDDEITLNSDLPKYNLNDSLRSKQKLKYKL